MRVFRNTEEVLFYFTCKKPEKLSEIFALLEQVLKLSYPLPRQDPRFKELLTSLVHRMDEAPAEALSQGAPLLHKLSADTSLAPKLLPICLIYKNMFNNSKQNLSPTDYVYTVGFLAKHKSIENDVSVLRQLMEHAPGLRPHALVVLLEILFLYPKQKELVSETISRVCLNIRASDYLTAYSAADLTVGLWKFIPHMRSSVARASLYDLAQVWIPKFPSFSVNRKIPLLLALSEFHVSLPEVDTLARTLVRDVANAEMALSPNRLVEVISICALQNINSDVVDAILERVRIEKSVFAISADNRVNLLWALHVLDRESHPLAKLLIDHFNQIAATGVPYQLRSMNGFAKKLHDVVKFRELRWSGRQEEFTGPLREGLAAADAVYFDRCVTTTGFYREASVLLKEFIMFDERYEISGVLAPLVAPRERLVVEFDTGRDSYDFRLRKRIWKKLDFRILVVSERMWRSVKRNKSQRRFVQESLDKTLNN